MSTRSIALASSAALVLALTAGTTLTFSAHEPDSTLEGVWRTVEVVVPGPDARTLRPGATLAIFRGRHYSRNEVHSEEPRPLLADQATASAEQLRAVWGPFVGEAGTFELSNGVLTMHATVAKNPAAMASGASSAYTYRREGDVLTLTQLQTHAGPRSIPITIKLTRVE